MASSKTCRGKAFKQFWQPADKDCEAVGQSISDAPGETDPLNIRCARRRTMPESCHCRCRDPARCARIWLTPPLGAN
jgi:hypothetical protein